MFGERTFVLIFCAFGQKKGYNFVTIVFRLCSSNPSLGAEDPHACKDGWREHEEMAAAAAAADGKFKCVSLSLSSMQARAGESVCFHCKLPRPPPFRTS